VTHSRRLAPTPDAITAALGRRLTELRQAAGIRSQSELGKRMTAHGVPWSRVSVEKLENGRRGAITVQELLALALVLNVPPAMLLADPSSTEPVQVASDVQLDGWSALYWLIGLGKPAAGEYGQPVPVLREALHFAQAVADVPPGVGPPRREDSDVARAREALVSAALATIRDALIGFADMKVPLPPLPPHVRQAARHYGVDLPGVEEG
jgi:transcriptional regulator with XRE-family HTH domain